MDQACSLFCVLVTSPVGMAPYSAGLYATAIHEKAVKVAGMVLVSELSYSASPMFAALLSEARVPFSAPVSQFCPRSSAATAGLDPVDRSEVKPDEGAKLVHVTLAPLRRAYCGSVEPCRGQRARKASYQAPGMLPDNEFFDSVTKRTVSKS